MCITALPKIPLLGINSIHIQDKSSLSILFNSDVLVRNMYLAYCFWSMFWRKENWFCFILEKIHSQLIYISLLFLYFYVARLDKNHRHIIVVHYPQPVPCHWYKGKIVEDPKLNLVVHHMLSMPYPNTRFLYWHCTKNEDFH